jgi:hypothetical protein
VADDTIDNVRHQRMPGLDSHQTAEPRAEHKDRPDVQGGPSGEEDDANPANGIPVVSMR